MNVVSGFDEEVLDSTKEQVSMSMAVRYTFILIGNNNGMKIVRDDTNNDNPHLSLPIFGHPGPLETPCWHINTGRLD